VSGITAIATAVSALLAAVTGILGWQLSRRVQQMAARRQEAIDQGPFIEQQRIWQTEIVAWYKDRIRELERDCEAEQRRLRAAYTVQIREMEAAQTRALQVAENLAKFWKERAMGRTVSDATIPPEMQGL
jgi:hypothetical protein